jgi:hypothetical protein
MLSGECDPSVCRSVFLRTSGNTCGYVCAWKCFQDALWEGVKEIDNWGVDCSSLLYFTQEEHCLKGGEVEDEHDEYDTPISNPLPPPPNKQRNEKCGRRSGT